MNWIKAHAKQLATLILSLAVFAATKWGWHGHTLSLDEAAIIGAVLASYGIHLQPITYGARFAALQKAKAALKAVPPAVLLILAFGALGGASQTACNAAQKQTLVTAIPQVPADVLDGISCIESVALITTGTADPTAIIATCSKFGVDLTSVYNVIASLIREMSGGDAGAAAASPLLPHLLQIQQNTTALFAQKAKSK